MTRPYVSFTEQHGSSISDLHYKLGKLLEDVPGQLLTRDNGDRTNTDRRYFREIECVRGVDTGLFERLDQQVEIAREEMGEEVWRKLNAEWGE